MKKTLITIALTALAVLLLVAIASTSMFGGVARQYSPGFGGGGGAAEYYSMEAPAQPAAPVMDAMGVPMAGGGDSGDLVKLLEQTNSSVTDGGPRLVIKNADLAIVVRDPKADMARISKLAEDMGGFVVASNLYQSFYGVNNIEVPEATVTIRVPSDRLDEALAKIKETVVEVDYENVSGQDVTSQYVDLQSRLTAKQAAEKKLLEILDDAEDAEDVLAIYLQVQTVQTEIEVLKGQIKYYEESAALSSISVRLIAEEGTQPISIGPWRPEGAAKEAVEDLVRFFQNFVEFLIRFVIFTLPSLILIAIPLYLVFLGGRAIFRRFAKSETKAEEHVEEKK